MPFSLNSKAILSLLVLCDLMQGVPFALLALAVGLLCLRNVHHGDENQSKRMNQARVCVCVCVCVGVGKKIFL